MTSETSRESILRAARRQFAEHGFARATVRDIAREAGVSAALVIKLFTSKAQLYADAGHLSVPLTEMGLPRTQMGRALVQRVVSRRDDDLNDPWATIALSVRDAPDPAAARRDFAANSLKAIASLIDDTTPALTHASIVACHLIGLAEGIRALRLFPEDTIASDNLVDLWAPIIQTRIDAIDRADTDSGAHSDHNAPANESESRPLR